MVSPVLQGENLHPWLTTMSEMYTCKEGNTSRLSEFKVHFVSCGPSVFFPLGFVAGPLRAQAVYLSGKETRGSVWTEKTRFLI